MSIKSPDDHDMLSRNVIDPTFRIREVGLDLKTSKIRRAICIWRGVILLPNVRL